MRPLSSKASKASLDATLARIIGQVRIVPDSETLGRPVACIRCQDRGVIEMISGSYELAGDRYGRRGRRIDATLENPIYVGCDCRKKQGDRTPARKGVYE